MATVEVSEHQNAPMQYGATVPLKRLPDKNTQLTTGGSSDRITLQNGTKHVRVVASADVRMKWTADGTLPGDPAADTAGVLIKANMPETFWIDTNGTRLRFG